MAGIRSLHAFAVKNAEKVGTFTLRKKDEDGTAVVAKLTARPDIAKDGVTFAAVRAAAQKGGGSVSFTFPVGEWDGQDRNLVLLGDKFAELLDRGNESADPPADDKPTRKARFSANGTHATDPAPTA